MPKLHDKRSGALLGNVSDADIRLLVDQLEEEHRTDQDYYINGPTIELLEEAGASSELVNLLRQALGDADGVEIRWER